MLPNLETRRIKRSGSMFTVSRIGDLNKTERGLCDYCGRFPCSLRGVMDKGTISTVHACEIFIPVLSFSVLDGLDQPIWNTIRIGAAWPKRMGEGQTVAIADTVNKRIVKRMSVKGMSTAPLAEICERHAKYNHAILHRQPEDPVTEMMRIMRNAYGSNFAAAGRNATAIYLREIDETANKS